MCSLGGEGKGADRERETQRESETQRTRKNFAAGMKGFSSWSRAGGMFSRHDKGRKYFI